jgi:membrane protein
VASSYGAAGSLVLLVIWVYYSSIILFFGAEFTQVYAKHFGSRIRPSDKAVPLTDEARGQMGLSPRQGTHSPT